MGNWLVYYNFMATVLPADDTDGKISWPQVAFTGIITLGTIIIMGAGIWLIHGLWRMIIEVITDADKDRVRAIKSLLGTVTIGHRERVYAVGTGLLGTIIILAICLVAVIWGLRFKFG